MEVKVLDFNGKILEESSTFWFSIEPNNHAVYLDVKQYLANQRQGTHKAKERWSAGSTRKIKTKGTGTARAGSKLCLKERNSFGPRPRSYSFKLNKTWRDWQENLLLYKSKRIKYYRSWRL
jgi:large subunit ribosomal protein L4